MDSTDQTCATTGPSLDGAVKTVIRDALDSVAGAVPGFRCRATQRRMIAEIAKTLAGECGDHRIIAVEAPTGTGKSLAYCLGAIPVAQALGHRVVIATATVALQEQLVNKDLPLFATHSGLTLEWRLAKGRRRYVCNRDLARLAGTGVAQDELEFGQSAAWDHKPSDAENATVSAMAAQLADGRFDGDLDNWPESLPEALRQAITTDNHGCLGRQCSYFDDCAFYNARAMLDQADVVVANHDLVLADLGMGGGVILPKPEDTIYIFDEGHHLSRVAIDHMAGQSLVKGAKRWLEPAPRTVSEVQGLLHRVAVDPQAFQESVDHLTGVLDGLYQVIDSAFPEVVNTAPRRRHAAGAESDTAVWRLEHGVVPTAFAEVVDEARRSAATVCKQASTLRDALREAVREEVIDVHTAGRAGRSLGWLVARLDNLAHVWSLWAEPDPGGLPPTARWITRVPDKDGIDYQVSVGRTSVAPALRERLWERAAGAVITSATLTAVGSFDRLREDLGLGTDDGTQYLALASPFDYRERAQLVVAAMEHDPRDTHAHTREVARQLVRCVDPHEGTLVLFASWRQLRDVADRIPEDLRTRVLVQGDQPKHALLAAHRQRIGAGEGSILFGVASFAQGIDLPGDECTHVVIAKLPFAVPDEPVAATYAEWLRAQGRNPFMELAVPDAGLKLIQACGRLLRSEDDHGRVTLLDRRVVTKPYGRVLLDALPPFRRVIEPVAGDGPA